MSAIHGRDDGDLRKYRTEIPNIVFTLGLDPYALALYCHLKRTTGAADGGLCWKSTRTLANETGMSVGKVSEARNELEKERDELGGKSLITVERPDDRGKTATVICNDIWPENFGVFTTRTRACSPHERKKEPAVEEGLEANASSGMANSSPPQSVALEKYVVDGIYQAMTKNETPLDSTDYGFHLGRAKQMLDKMQPTDAELDELPTAFVDTWTIKGKADAKTALMEIRRQKARTDVISQGRSDGPSFYDKQVSARDKPRSPVWYASVYDMPYETVETWIAEGLGHEEIERRSERGESSAEAGAA